MTTKELFKLILEDPQQAVDAEIEFCFVGVVGSVRMVDGFAAGSAWYQFEFLTGPFVGKKPYCLEAFGYDRKIPGFQHLLDANDDGEVFNSTTPNTEAMGDPIPELNGRTLRIDKLL